MNLFLIITGTIVAVGLLVRFFIKIFSDAIADAIARTLW
jgi:hypothetical protein